MAALVAIISALIPILTAIFKAVWNNKLLASILIAIVTFASLTTNLFGWLWDNVTKYVLEFVQWLFDPSTVATLGVDIVQAILKVAHALLPSSLAASVDSFSTYVQGIPFRNAVDIFLWFWSPLFPSAFLLDCARAMIGIWFTSWCVRMGLWIVGKARGSE